MEKNKIYSKYLDREVTYVIKMSEKPTDKWLYFFDGQNIHDPKEATFGESWEVENSTSLIGQNFNIVGIYSFGHFERVSEYLPFDMESEGEFMKEDMDKVSSKGELTGKFIVNELIPFLEKKEAKSRLIGGSSMGGVMSLYMGAKYPKVFDRILAMSTAPFFAPMGQAHFMSKFDPKYNQYIYLDVGTNEHPDEIFRWGYVALNRMLYGFLKDFPNVKYVEANGDEHNESFWRKRLPNALKFLYKE